MDRVFEAAVMAIPARIAPLLVAESDPARCEAIIASAIDQALNTAEQRSSRRSRLTPWPRRSRRFRRRRGDPRRGDTHDRSTRRIESAGQTWILCERRPTVRRRPHTVALPPSRTILVVYAFVRRSRSLKNRMSPRSNARRVSHDRTRLCTEESERLHHAVTRGTLPFLNATSWELS